MVGKTWNSFHSPVFADSVMITSGALHKDSFDQINTYLKAFPHFFKF